MPKVAIFTFPKTAVPEAMNIESIVTDNAFGKICFMDRRYVLDLLGRVSEIDGYSE